MDGSWAKFGCWVLDVFSLRYTGEEVRMIGESQAAAGRNQRNDLRSARACARVHARERERERGTMGNSCVDQSYSWDQKLKEGAS